MTDQYWTCCLLHLRNAFNVTIQTGLAELSVISILAFGLVIHNRPLIASLCSVVTSFSPMAKADHSTVRSESHERPTVKSSLYWCKCAHSDVTLVINIAFGILQTGKKYLSYGCFFFSFFYTSEWTLHIKLYSFLSFIFRSISSFLFFFFSFLFYRFEEKKVEHIFLLPLLQIEEMH